MTTAEIKLFLSRPRNLFLILVGFSLATIFIVVIYTILMVKAPQEELANITPEQKKGILSEIVNNNSQTLFDSRIYTDENENGAVKPKINPNKPELGQPGSSTLPDPEAIPNIEEYNYRETTVKLTEGPAAEFCKMTNHGCGMVEDSNGVSTSYEYFDLNNSLYKYTLNDHHNELSSYRLVQYSNSVNEMKHYMGGEFGVNFKYKVDSNFTNYREYESISYPVSYANGSLENKIQQYFGNNVEITNILNKDGKEYYEIQMSYKTFCNTSNPYLVIPGVEPAKEETIVTVMLVETKSFDIVNTDTYFRSVAEENLISSREVEVVRKKTTLNQVDNIFEFDYQVPLRIINYADVIYDYSIDTKFNEIKSYLSNQNFDLLFLDDGMDYSLTNLNLRDTYQQVDGADYYLERAFYSNSESGEEKYQSAMLANQYIYPLINMNYKLDSNYEYLTINIYENGISQDQVIEDITKFQASTSSEAIFNLNIDGTEIEAKLLTRTYDYNYPTSYPTSYPTYSYNNQYLVFEYGGMVYNLSYDPNELAVDDLVLTELHTGVEEELDIILAKVWEYLVGPYGFNYPPSYPLSYPY